MSFSSLQFLIFFPIVTLLYFGLPHRFRWSMLLVASCIFYMAFVPVYILILLFTIGIDYWAGLAIHRSEGPRRKWYLVLSLVANIGVLAFFKYYNFFIENVNGLIQLAGVHSALPLLRIVLPIGLSFHTFQAMSYTIEVYRGNQEPERHLGIYALYVMFYPQLVAGPIERPQNLLHQFHERHQFSYEDMTAGLKLMSWGYFKKAVIADRVGVGVDTIYNSPHAFSGAHLIVATVLFAFQIYADFSGYSDIARGAARAMGFRLMRNFNSPYGARNISEFWRRWHMSLYTWFNDYLYSTVSLGLRDWGKAGVVLAVMTTFAVSGLWHGAAWTFIVWGALHGLAVTAELLTRRWRTKRLRIPAAVGVPVSALLTFAFVCFTFIWFRARSVGDAAYVVAHLGSGMGELAHLALHPGRLTAFLTSMGFFRVDEVIIPLALAIMLVGEQIASRVDFEAVFAARPWYLRWAAYYAVELAFVFLGAHNAVQPFIYFQF
jgi:D-alanyl-lipoteichoic acid acyltransferase DltB (MBOAT superfamily)